MRFKTEKTRGGYMLRVFHKWGERAYIIVGLRGPQLQIEFPSEWHEAPLAWAHIGLGLIDFNFSFPWRTVAPDHGQCSGPRYGFYFMERYFVWQWGHDTGRSKDRRVRWSFDLPWAWSHIRHSFYWPDGKLHHHAAKGEYRHPEETQLSFPYTYTLRSGTVQHRTATVNGEEMEWRWNWLKWLPWPRKIRRSIGVSFDDEVGEETGSWKGGCMGCGYEWKRDETLEQALRRMERERKF